MLIDTREYNKLTIFYESQARSSFRSTAAATFGFMNAFDFVCMLEGQSIDREEIEKALSQIKKGRPFEHASAVYANGAHLVHGYWNNHSTIKNGREARTNIRRS